MRLRIGLALLALVLLVAAILIARRRSTNRERGGSSVTSQSSPGSSDTQETVKPKSSNPKTGEEPAKADVAAARRALATCLGGMSLWKINDWSQNLEAMHGGASPEFRAFARAFIAAAGEDLIPLVKTLLAECGSDEAKFLLVAVLGESRRPESFPLLKDFLSDAPSPQAAASALYSIGRVRSGEGLEYLKNWFASNKPADKSFLLAPALAAVGLHGADAVDFMVAQARLRKSDHLPSGADVVGMIRGDDAVEPLRKLLDSEVDGELKRGAATALGFSNNSKVLLSLADLEPGHAAIALMAPRDVPDIWGQFAILRSEIATAYLARTGAPAGDWKKDAEYLALAMLIPPEKARKLYESLTASYPADESVDRVVWFKKLVGAFGDQPDFGSRIEQLAKDSGITPYDLHRAINMGIQHGAIPGRSMGSSKVVAEMLARAVDPSAHAFTARYEMHTVMRSEYPASALSSTLIDLWRSPGSNHENLLASVQAAAFRLQPPLASIHCSHPEAFLAEVIREEGNLDHRIRAAYAYLTVSDAQSPDQGVLRTIPDLIEGAALDMTKTPRTAMWIGSVIGCYYARVGTPADIPRLQSMAATFPLPPGWTADNRAAFERELNRDVRRAIDAIRLRGN